MLELLYYPLRRYDPTFGFVAACDTVSERLVERIVSTYRRQREAFTGYGCSIWESIDRRRAEIDDLMINGAISDIRAMLLAPATGDLLFGYENTFADYVSVLRADKERQAIEARWIHDAATRLAEAVGAVALAGPEAPHLERVVSPSKLIAAIEQTMGLELAFPNPFVDEFGIDTPRGTASLRALHAIYQAYRLNSLRPLAGGGCVLEIGAGLGRTAYYAATLFSMPYTIYDLPLTNVAQAFFLGSVLGEDAVALADEEFDPNRHRVRILSVGRPLGPEDACDIALNVDSLTELDRCVASAYVDFIRQHAAVFLSINHEAQAFTVAEILAERKMPALRAPYWMRKGYVEEVWLRR